MVMPDENENLLLNRKESSASCRIDQIIQLSFGGFTSRFWALRKHVNCLNKEREIESLPFYSWQCLNLRLEHREVDLVVREQSGLNLLVQYLVAKMNTLDGMRGSAKKVGAPIQQVAEKTYIKFKVISLR